MQYCSANAVAAGDLIRPLVPLDDAKGKAVTSAKRPWSTVEDVKPAKHPYTSTVALKIDGEWQGFDSMAQFERKDEGSRKTKRAKA